MSEGHVIESERHTTQVDVLIYSLLEATNDQKIEVKQAVSNSLHKLGNKRPNLMLDISLRYLQKNTKLSHSHRTIVLNTMAEVCKAQLQAVDDKLACEIINFCVEEMIRVKEVIPDWQSAASSVLVALGHRFCYEVMESLNPKFQPGVIPHYFVIQTLGDLAMANVFSMIPFLKAILQTTLTIIGSIKHDNMKWVIAHALGRFGEAILEYIANIEKSPDQSVRKEVFSTEFSVAYGTLFQSWLPSKEIKLKVAVVEAIGFLSQLLSKEKLDEELPRLIPGILACMHKRYPDPYFASQALSMILESATNNCCVNLEPLFDSIIYQLFLQIDSIPDYSQPLAVKNHNEVLRCFAIISKVRSDQLIAFLIPKIDNRDEKYRIGSLIILRHLINTKESLVSDKMATILVGVKPVLNETNNKVKKVLAQVIVALAHHGYLELDGSRAMTEFIIQQCALSDDPILSNQRRQSDSGAITNSELRFMCENILDLLASIVGKVNKIFWPHILEFLISEKLTNAIGVVCKCATHMGTYLMKDRPADYEIDFESHKNLPKPVQIISRLIVLLGQPKAGNGRGVHILTLMQILIPSLEKNLSSSWDAAIPNLIHYLEDQSIKFSQADWHKKILKFLLDSIAEVDRQEWTFSLAKTFGEQMQLYAQNPEDKNFCFKCLGTIMMKCNAKAFVNDVLDLIFKNVCHSVTSDREGCAAAVGFCAATHMDSVLVKLDTLARVDFPKKTRILWNFMDFKNDLDNDMWVATIVLCYGYVSMGAPTSLLTARIESPILRNVNGFFLMAKHPTIRLSLIQMTEMIANSLHPSSIRERFSFRSKIDLLKHMGTFILSEKELPLKSNTVSQALDACTALIKLDPALQCDERLPLLKICYDTVFPLHSSADRAKADNYEEEEGYGVLLESTIDSLRRMLRELLLQDITANNFYNLFVGLEIWFLSMREIERERAISCVFHLSKCFMDNLSTVLGGTFTFDNHGAIIARLVPRCTDPSLVVREQAFMSIYIVLKILLRHEGFNADHVDKDVEHLQELKFKATKNDPDMLYSISVDLAKILSNKLSAIQLRQFLDVLMEGLIDGQDGSSSGTCVVLNHVLKNKAVVLQQELETLINLLYNRLGEISCIQTRRGTFQIIRTLASFQLTSVLNCLLSYELPLDDNLIGWWTTLAQDNHLNGSIIEQFCEIIVRNAPYTEYPDPRNKKEIIRIATPKVLAVISAMQVMFTLPEMEATATKEFPKLFTILLSMVGCFTDVYPPSIIKESPKDPNAKPMIVIHSNKISNIPNKAAIEAFKSFLTCAKAKSTSDNDYHLIWEVAQNNADINSFFARFIAETHPQYLPGVVTGFNPLLSSPFDSQRIVAVSFFAELICHHQLLDRTALELLLNSMMGRLLDSSRDVRRLAIRGLGSIGKLDAEHMDSLEWFGVYKYSNTVLSAMMSGLDDKDDPNGEIALEAMHGLCQVLTDMDESHVESALLNIVMRLRPSFESNNTEIRAASYKLFGVLARFCKGSVETSFVDQLHGNLVSLLLHLNDENKMVIKTCKSALRSVGPYLGADSVNEMFQKHLIDESQLYYREFIGDLSKIMVVAFPDRLSHYVATCVSYFKSSWPIIRSNAAMLAGCLLGNIPEEMRTDIANESTFGAFTKLLRDSSTEVRVKVAEAISQLHSY